MNVNAIAAYLLARPWDDRDDKKLVNRLIGDRVARCTNWVPNVTLIVMLGVN